MKIDKWEELPLDKMIMADWNYKNDDEAKQRSLVNNIRKNGQIENILVRELDGGKYEVVNGNHRYLAFIELGMKTAMTYNLGKITLAKAKRIAVETNETRFSSDTFKLTNLMADIMVDYNKDDLANTMPFSRKELDEFDSLLDFDWGGKGSAEVDGFQESNDDDSIVLAFDLPYDLAESFKAQLNRFKKVLNIENAGEALQAMTQHIAQATDEEIMELS